MIAGMKPAPMPCSGCSPGPPPDSTGLASGSTATMRRPGRRGFSACAQPVMVPPVPTPEMIASTWPSVSYQISSAVVRRWIAGLAGLPNWFGITAPGVSASSSSARAIAPRMPFSRGVSTTSAPRWRSILRRSTETDSGMVSTTR